MKRVFKMKQTVLAAVLFSGAAAFAQTAVVAPSAPTTVDPVMPTVGAAAALSTASTNRVFIDQNGSNPNVSLSQEGNTNKMGPITGGATTTDPIYLRGGNQTVNAVQKGGNSNELGLSLVTPDAANSTEGPKVTIQQIGNSNKIDAKIGIGTLSNGTTSIANATGVGKGVELNWKFKDDSNQLQFRAGGDNIKSAIDVDGNGNKIFIDALGNGHSQAIKSVGSSVGAGTANEFNFSQTSTGASGSSITVDVNGAGNKFNIAQSGAIDNVVNIKSVATSGTWNITQK